MKEIHGLLPEIPGATTRLFQVPIDIIRGNRSLEFTEKFFKHSSFVLMEQTHGNSVVEILHANPGLKTYPNVDGCYTKERGVVLGVLTGDCMAITFYDPKSRAVAACHAGYTGVLSDIAGSIIKKYFSSSVGDLQIVVSPFIGKCCYNIVESKDGRIEKFQKKYSSDVIRKKGDDVYLDLQKAAMTDLSSLGVSVSNIHFSEECTSCSSLELPSHYRSKYSEGRKRTHTLITTIEINA